MKYFSLQWMIVSDVNEVLFWLSIEDSFVVELIADYWSNNQSWRISINFADRSKLLR